MGERERMQWLPWLALANESTRRKAKNWGGWSKLLATRFTYIVRGSIAGTRLDLEEALAFAAEGKVRVTIETVPLESINDVLSRLKKGDIRGRIVLDMKGETAVKRAAVG
jgi:hypothetical protein